MSPTAKKTASKIAPHLPSEIRKIGAIDTAREWYVLKTVGLAALFGFFAGLVGGIAVNTRLGEDLLWGPNSKAREYFISSEAEHIALSREALAQKSNLATAGLYKLSSLSGAALPREEDRLASAFFLTADGYLATAYTTIRAQNPKDWAVVTADGRVLRVETLIADPATDLSIIKVNGSNFDVLPFVNDDRLGPGSFAYLVVPGVGLVSSEIASANALARIQRASEPFNSDMPHRFGLVKTSAPDEAIGSPLLNLKGEIIGVIGADKDNRAILRAGLLKSAFASALKNKKIIRPSLGIHFYEATQLRNQERDSQYASRGAVLAGDAARGILPVERKSPLARLGLRAGDRILALNNENITSVRTLQDILFDYNAGEMMEIAYVSGGQEHKISVKVGSISR